MYNEKIKFCLASLKTIYKHRTTIIILSGVLLRTLLWNSYCLFSSIICQNFVFENGNNMRYPFLNFISRRWFGNRCHRFVLLLQIAWKLLRFYLPTKRKMRTSWIYRLVSFYHPRAYKRPITMLRTLWMFGVQYCFMKIYSWLKLIDRLFEVYGSHCGRHGQGPRFVLTFWLDLR